MKEAFLCTPERFTNRMAWLPFVAAQLGTCDARLHPTIPSVCSSIIRKDIAYGTEGF